MTFRCTACQHTWPLPLALPAPIDDFCRALAQPCPECGAPNSQIVIKNEA